jgi:hypothetical protein
MFPDPRLLVPHCGKANRREQTAQALKQVDTRLIILQDDHTYWPSSPHFIPSVIAPFEDPKCGAVSADLRARHCKHPFSWRGFWNFMGMTYLVRRSYEYRGTYGIDRGLSTLPAGFGVFRTERYASEEFLDKYLNEHVPFSSEALNADDDKFHTRWLIEHDWDIGLQAGPESHMMTELGEWPKFRAQVLRWARTSWRSNPQQLRNWWTWRRHPFMSYSLLMWFCRSSLVQEALMVWPLHGMIKQAGKLDYFPVSALALWTWIVALKYIKVSEHFWAYPGDIVYFPEYLLCGHFHALIKAYAFCTMWKTTWPTAENANGKTKIREPGKIENKLEHQATDGNDAVDGKTYLGFQITLKRPTPLTRMPRYQSNHK